MKFISVKKEKILVYLYVVVIFFGLMYAYSNKTISTFMPLSKKVILVDAGHGGWDPGKVGEGNILEKDINLAVADKLQRYLEQGGSYVITTREDDSALGDRKNSDLNGRREIANNGKADILVSIHQNSFPQQEVKGAQVFYYNESDESLKLATSIQNEIKNFVLPNNKFSPKANTNYYLLKQTNIPSVIVECGFLSNTEELANLAEEEYQEKIAWAIYMGITKFLN